MMRYKLMMPTMGAGQTGHLRQFYKRNVAALAVAGTLLAGCGGGSMFGSSSDPSPSIGDRFGQLFGSKSQAVGEAAPAPAEDELSCPPVAIRAGASTFAVADPGKQAVGSDLHYQATITRTARDCKKVNGQILARVGIQGRVIEGPAGAPSTVEIPMRVAVVQGGVQEKTITTKAYRTTVTMSSDTGSTPFSLVAEDLVYPVPQGGDGDAYIFYIGFDPQALKPEPKTVARKKK